MVNVQVTRRYIAALIFLSGMVCAEAVPAAENDACAVIEAAEQRLECYDKQAALAQVQEIKRNDEYLESPLKKRIESEKKISILGDFIIVPHRPTYIMPVTYQQDVNTEPYIQAYGAQAEQVDKAEFKYQISFKVPLWLDIADKDMSLWFGYTQLSLWQIYNTDNSSPFRETNYEPELMLVFDTDFKLFGMNNTFITIGFDHQSNGQTKPLSRSWNRLYANFVLETKNVVMFVKPWLRLPEDDDDDDNPDIEDYMGYGELSMYFKNENRITGIRLWNNLDSENNRTSIQLDWNFPIGSGFKGYVQYFNGYGETLVDYNYRNKRIGFGVMLTDWF
ncbi:MAG: phospholipase A [Gammaproteobacteria bacterium]|nr:phospholipase A [Gammaproteobacteria bacterium]MCW8923823.1 phospholipase A [Gammaproteobacteria bacterium]